MCSLLPPTPLKCCVWVFASSSLNNSWLWKSVHLASRLTFFRYNLRSYISVDSFRMSKSGFILLSYYIFLTVEAKSWSKGHRSSSRLSCMGYQSFIVFSSIMSSSIFSENMCFSFSLQQRRKSHMQMILVHKIFCPHLRFTRAFSQGMHPII